MPQGTVKRYDPSTRTATLLDDRLVQHEVDRRAISVSGLLELRLGQRVRYEVEDTDDGGQRITNLHVVSL